MFREVIVLTPAVRCFHLISIGGLIDVCEEAYDGCVVSKLKDGVRAVPDITVVSEQGVQEGAEDTALRHSCVEDQCRGEGAASSHHLWPFGQEVSQL